LTHIPVCLAGIPPHIPRDIDQYKAPLKGLSAEDIVQQISVNVGNFIERQLDTESERTILFLGRKARLLFQPYLDTLIYKGYSPAYIRKLDHSSWTTGGILKHVSFLADCINTGEETIHACKVMAKRNRLVDKIYCYALNTKALNELNSNRLTSKIPIIVAHSLDDAEFRDFFKRIQVYYQSLVEPLDSDHAYDIYSISSYLTQNEVERIIEAAIRTVLGKEKIGFVDDPCNSILCLPNNMENLFFNILDDIDSNHTSLSPAAKDLIDLAEFENRYFQLKIIHKEALTKFSIMSCFTVNSLERTKSLLEHENGCMACASSKCYLEIVTSDLPVTENQAKLCPLCIENFVERSILDRISEFARYFFAAKGFVSVHKHDPIER
jgi:hypothetical protein